MIESIFFAGIGIIVALGGLILLDRERFNRAPRHSYRLATVAGLAVSAMAIVGIL